MLRDGPFALTGPLELNGSLLASEVRLVGHPGSTTTVTKGQTRNGLSVSAAHQTPAAQRLRRPRQLGRGRWLGRPNATSAPSTPTPSPSPPPPPLLLPLMELPPASFLRIAADAPPVVLSGLTFQNSSAAPAVSVAGELRVEACVFAANSATALTVVSGGRVHVSASRFVGNAAEADGSSEGTGGGGGGAIHARDSHVMVKGSVFEDNTGTDGGALLATDGALIMVGDSTFRYNRAWSSGGAVYAARYAQVVLMNRTLLDGNRAGGSGDSIAMEETASCSYALPAPLGHWMASFVHCNAADSSSASAANSSGVIPTCGAHHNGLTIWPLTRHFDEEMPFRCAPGVIGSTESNEGSQLSPTCSGACPAGSYCEAGTLRPAECPAGHWCPPGAAAGIPCDAGTYNAVMGSSSATACEEVGR